jgi:hypothetical protein
MLDKYPHGSYIQEISPTVLSFSKSNIPPVLVKFKAFPYLVEGQGISTLVEECHVNVNPSLVPQLYKDIADMLAYVPKVHELDTHYFHR